MNIINNKKYYRKYSKVYKKISHFLLSLLMATIPLYSFYQFHGISLSRIMPFVLLANIIWSVPLFLKIKKNQIKILLPLFAFLIYAAISVYSHWDLYGIPRFKHYVFEPIGYTFIFTDLANFSLLIFLFLRLQSLNKKKIISLIKIFCISVLIFNILGFVVWNNVSDQRLLGGTNNPNTIGQDMAICFIFITLLVPAIKGNKKLSLGAKFSAIIFLIFCLLSGSRSALLFSIFPFFCLFLIKKRKLPYFKYAISILLILFLVIWIFSTNNNTFKLNRLIEKGRDITTESRWTTWEESVKSWLNAPFLGKGWRLVFDKPSHWAPHNTILMLLESLGIVGFLLFSLFYLQILKILYQKWRKTTSQKRYLILIYLIIFLDITAKSLVGGIMGNRTIFMLAGFTIYLPFINNKYFSK